MKVTTTSAFVAYIGITRTSADVYAAVSDAGVGLFIAAPTLTTTADTVGAAFADTDMEDTWNASEIKTAAKLPTSTVAGYWGYYTAAAVAIEKLGAASTSLALATGMGKIVTTVAAKANTRIVYHGTSDRKAVAYGPCAAGSADNLPTACYCSAAEQTANSEDTADPKTKGCTYSTGYFMSAFSAVIVAVAYFL
jgi:hypothetical protein